ncbi:MAG: TIR domain-containing protein [Lachnospiraceae bacterium]|nr:TIR domain-containing protein [Lachnospiraceae bacterium]
MSSFFISHSSIDQYLAHEIYNRLKEQGHNCWIAPESIKYGEPWPAAIEKGIKEQSGAFLLLLSKNANSSKYVLDEVNIADESNLRMVVFRIGDFILNNELRFRLSNTHIYNCHSNDEAGLIREISDIILGNDWKDWSYLTLRRAAVQAQLEVPEDYVSREQEQRIDEILAAGKICTLYGEGGMGKSSLAKSWYQNHRESYKEVLFINAETMQDVMKDLGIQESETIGEYEYVIRKAIQRELDKALDNSEDKALIMIDNLSYDRGAQFEQFDKRMSSVITEFGEKPNIDILVTTRLKHVLYEPTEMIYVGDFTEEQALEYLKKNYKGSFNKDTVCRLVHAYGMQDHKTGKWSIPAISCVAIKNAAIQFGGYDRVTRTNGSMQELSELVFTMVNKLSHENVTSRLFAEILKLASFLDGDALRVHQLCELAVQWSDCSDEQFLHCMSSFDSRLTLLNYVDQDRRDEMTIHRVFQHELNELVIMDECKNMKKVIIRYFLSKVHPFSYYGTQTFADPDAMMQHFLAFHEIVKAKSKNDKDYYRVLRAAAWYYGYVSRDRDIFTELSEDLCGPFSQASQIEKQMGAIDRELILIALGDHHGVGDRLREMRFGIERLMRQNKGNDTKMLQIRYQIACAFYESLYGTLEANRNILAQVEKNCQDMILLFEGGELTEEQMVFVTESLAVLYSKQSELERKRKGSGNFEESLKYCDLAIKCLDNEGYQWCLDQLGMNNAASYLRAHVINLQGVTYNERNASLEEQYEAERLNSTAEKEYRSIHYMPGIANQQLNYVNVFRAQAEDIINAVNTYVSSKGKPASPSEWKKRYESEEIVPEFRNREGQLMSVKAWIQEFRKVIDQAKEQREYSRITRESYSTPISEFHYTYMVPLAACERKYNAYTREQKRALLMQTFNVPVNTDEQDELEKALDIPGVETDTLALISRYEATLQRYILENTVDADEWQKRYQKAVYYLDKAEGYAKSAGNEKALKHIEDERKSLEKLAKAQRILESGSETQ